MTPASGLVETDDGRLETGVIHGFLLLSLDECDDAGRLALVWSGGMTVIPRRHHTEHLSTGFMGEPFGQWNTRENSSNWDTLPITLQGGREDTDT